METAGLILLILFFALGFLALLFGLPGTWIILISAAVYGWATGFRNVDILLLALLCIAATAGEVLEHLLGLAGATRFGASRKGALASLAGGIIGAVAGAPVFFGLGALIGLFAGAFAGAFLYEWVAFGKLSHSLRSGFGAFLGRFSGTLLKLLLAVGMIAAVLFSIF